MSDLTVAKYGDMTFAPNFRVFFCVRVLEVTAIGKTYSDSTYSLQ